MQCKGQNLKVWFGVFAKSFLQKSFLVSEIYLDLRRKKKLKPQLKTLNLYYG